MNLGRWYVSGEPYVVVVDPDGSEPLTPERIETLQFHGANEPARAVVRAVRSEHRADGHAVLDEDPEAIWWCDTVLTTGERVSTSGNAVRALVDALLTWNLLELRDRRETIPVGTSDGVRDVLMGRMGYAVDLGRWRIIESHNDTSFLIRIGSEMTGVVIGDQPMAHAHDWAQLSTPEARTHGGIAHATIRCFDRRGAERASSSLGAVAAAIVLRHLGARDTPHHWSIEMPGGSLAVRMFPTEEGEHVSVSGAVTRVPHE